MDKNTVRYISESVEEFSITQEPIITTKEFHLEDFINNIKIELIKEENILQYSCTTHDDRYFTVQFDFCTDPLSGNYHTFSQSIYKYDRDDWDKFTEDEKEQLCIWVENNKEFLKKSIELDELYEEYGDECIENIYRIGS